MRETPGKIPIFFIEDMNLLACDLCFDIGNPIMDNLGGHIPAFINSRMLHVFSTAWLLFSKRFFLSTNHHRKIVEEQSNSPLKVFLNGYFMWNCSQRAAGAFVGFSAAFSSYFPPSSPPNPAIFTSCLSRISEHFFPTLSLVTRSRSCYRKLICPRPSCLCNYRISLASLLRAESYTVKQPPPSNLFTTNRWDFLVKNTLNPFF